MNISKKAIAEVRAVREADNRRYTENKINKWFEDMSIYEMSGLALIIWMDADYEEKLKIYKKLN